MSRLPATSQPAAAVVDVRDFGPLVTTGRGDNRATIQTAIDHALAHRIPEVHFPAGTFDCYAQLRTTDPDTINTPEGHVFSWSGGHVNLRGAGRARTLLVHKDKDGLSSATHWQTVSGKVWRGSMFYLHGADTAPADYRDRVGLTLQDITIDGGHPYNGRGLGQGAGGETYPADPATGYGWDLYHKCIYGEENRYGGDIRLIDCHIKNFGGEHNYNGGGLWGQLYVRNLESSGSWGDGLNPANSSLDVDGLYIHNCLQAIEGYGGEQGRIVNFLLANCTIGGVMTGGTLPVPRVPTRPTAGTKPMLVLQGSISKCGKFYGGAWVDADLTMIDTPLLYDGDGTQRGGAYESRYRILSICDDRQGWDAIGISGFTGNAGDTPIRDLHFQVTLTRTSNAIAHDYQHLSPLSIYGKIGRGVVLEHSEGPTRRFPNFGGQFALGGGWAPKLRDNAWRPGSRDGAYDYSGTLDSFAGGGTHTVVPIGDHYFPHLTSGTTSALAIATDKVNTGSQITVDTRNLGAGHTVTFAPREAGWSFPDGAGRTLHQNDKLSFEFDTRIGAWQMIAAAAGNGARS